MSGRRSGRKWHGAFSGGLGYNLSLTGAWPGMAGSLGGCPAGPFALSALGPVGHSGIPDTPAILTLAVIPMGGKGMTSRGPALRPRQEKEMRTYGIDGCLLTAGGVFSGSGRRVVHPEKVAGIAGETCQTFEVWVFVWIVADIF